MKTQSVTKSNKLKIVFNQSTHKLLHAHIARLCVLYEDLRIEIAGIAEVSIQALDATDDKFRRNYFLRRSILTVIEFAEELRLLNECSDFGIIKNSFDKQGLLYWKKAIEFFNNNESYLKQVRNDIGGHFGLNAAIYALSQIRPSVKGKIELFSPASDEVDIKFHFAGEIAAAAILRHKKRKTSKGHYAYLVKLVRDSYVQAIRCMHYITHSYLWGRFDT